MATCYIKMFHILKTSLERFLANHEGGRHALQPSLLTRSLARGKILDLSHQCRNNGGAFQSLGAQCLRIEHYRKHSGLLGSGWRRGGLHGLSRPVSQVPCDTLLEWKRCL